MKDPKTGEFIKDPKTGRLPIIRDLALPENNTEEGVTD